MENSLYIYHMVVPLRYYTYDLHSEKKDSEYVMGLKQDMDWNVTRIVEQPIPDTNQIFRREEPVHIHLFCENDVEHAVWGSSVYEPFETLLQKKEDFVETTE